MEYGIQTPYTSFIVTGETPQAKGDMGMGPRGGAGAGLPAGTPAPDPAKKAMDKLHAAKPETQNAAPPSLDSKHDEERKKEGEFAKTVEQGYKMKDGRSSVEAARYLRSLRESDRADSGKIALFKKAGANRYFEYRGVWVDERFEEKHQVTCVKFGSAAYFKLIDQRPEIVEALKLGTSVMFVTAPGKSILVCGSGEETLSDAKLAELFESK
jgi:hypothetical protein